MTEHQVSMARPVSVPERILVNICQRADSRVGDAVAYMHRERKELNKHSWYLAALAAKSKAEIVRLVLGFEPPPKEAFEYEGISARSWLTRSSR